MPRLTGSELDQHSDEIGYDLSMGIYGHAQMQKPTDKRLSPNEQALLRYELTKPNQGKKEQADGDVLFRRNDLLSVLPMERLRDKHCASPSPEDLLIAAETVLATFGREQAMEILSSL